MLEPIQSIKSTQPLNGTQSKEVIEFELTSIDPSYAEEYRYKIFNKKYDYLQPLFRKKRSNEAMDVSEASDSGLYSNKLVLDNNLQLIWYGENRIEKLNNNYRVFKEKIRQLIQSSLAGYPENENFGTVLSEKPYPTDYELGYFSLLVYEEDVGYKILGLAEENIEARLQEITADLNRIEVRLKDVTVIDKKRDQAEKEQLLTEQSVLLKKKSLTGWQLMGMASHPAINNGYVGAVYWHASKKQIVIANRGTLPSNLGALWSDIKGITANHGVAQMGSANTLCHLVLESLPIEIKSISFTGHSLGGWLAQITAFSSEYLEREGNNFKKRVSAVYHPHTVVFDSPGCQAMLLKLKRNFDLRYTANNLWEMNIHTLDIRTYLSAPNMINVCNTHVGTIYRLFPNLRDDLAKIIKGRRPKVLAVNALRRVQNYLLSETFLYTLRAHELNRLLNALPRNEDEPKPEEVQEVKDWPVFSNLIKSQEYDEFFKHAKNYHIEGSRVTKSGFVIRYRTQPVDFRSTSMCIFSAEERQLLDSMKILQDWFKEQKGHLVPDLHELTELSQFFQNKRLEEPVIANIMQAFKSYTLVDHGERLQARDSGGQIVPVINGLKQLLRRYPDIIDVAKREVEKRPVLIQAIYASESDRWINRLRDQIDLRWQINREQLNLVNFLSDREAKVLHIIADSEDMKSVISQLGYDVLMAIGKKDESFFDQLSAEEKVALDLYAHSDVVTFLSVEQIRLQQARRFDINKFYQSDKSSPLLWLEGELTDEDSWQIELFSRSLTKKIIVLTRAEGLFFQFLKNQPWVTEIYESYQTYQSKALAWSNLTLKSRQHVLERVIVQRENNLAKLIGFDTLTEILSDTPDEKVMALNRILDSKTLIQLINNRIDIGSPLERFTHLEAAYVKSRDVLVISKLKEALLRDFLTEETTRYLIISGLFDPDINVAKDRLIQHLGLAGAVAEAAKIKSKVDFYDISELGDKRIFIANAAFTEVDFKEFCRDYNLLELRVDWIHWKDNQFVLQYLYDPKFYINRKFYYKDKIIILDKIKDERISLQIENDLFIFSDVKFDKRPKFIIRLKNILQPFIPTMTEYVLEQFQKNEKIKNICVTLVSKDREVLFKSLAQMGSVHWLKQDEQNRLIWKHSEGPLEFLYRYIDEARTNNAQEILSEKDFINKVNKKTVLIIDEPGMGKTTALMKLSGSMLESNWVIRINPRIIEGAIKQLSYSEKITFSEVVEFLSAADRSGLGSDLAKNLIRYKLQHPNEGLPLLLLFDAFDEIKDDKKEGKKKVSLLLNFLKNKAMVWVTARKNEIKTLENSLSVFDTQLEELDIGDQKEFLKKFWYTRLFLTLPQNEGVFERKCKFYIEALLKRVNDLFKLDNYRFMGMPLQLQLLGEGFQEGFKAFVSNENSNTLNLENISILDLYEMFINARYHIFLEKENVPGKHDFLYKPMLRELNKTYRRLAFYQLLGNDVEVIDIIGIKSPFLQGNQRNQIELNEITLKMLFRVGLIQLVADHDYEFIHKSFAEYFVSEFLINQLIKVSDHHNHARVQKHLLTNILIKPEHQLIRVFFDEQLAKRVTFLSENLAEYADAIEVFWAVNFNDFFNEQGETALHVAVGEQHKKIFSFLLYIFKEKPEALIALFSARDRNGDNILYLAVKQDKKEYVKQLLESIKECSYDIKQKLLLSTMFRTNEDYIDPVIKKLLNEYIDPGEDNEIKEIANKIKKNWKLLEYFLEAAENRQLTTDSLANLKLFDQNKNIEFDFDQNTKTYLLLATNINRATALHLAIMNSHIFTKDYEVTVEALIRQGSNVNAEAQYHLVPVFDNLGNLLQYEITSLQDDITSFQYGMTPLQMIVSEKTMLKKQVWTVKKLLEAGAKIEVGQGDDAPLYLAAMLNNRVVVDILLDKGAEPNIQVPTGETPLYWAVFHDNQNMLDLFLANHAEVNVQTNDGYTPLYWAVSHNNEYMLGQLVKHGAETNIGYADTVPLYIAVRNNNLNMVLCLLRQGGAAVDIRGDGDNTLLLNTIIENLKDNLQSIDQEDKENTRIIVEWLVSYGMAINAGQNGQTLLYWAVRYADEPLVKILLDWGADVNVQLPNGETPLYWAVKKNKPALVQKLLDEGALVNIEVREGDVIHTPLSLVKENQNEAIKTMLLAKGAQDNAERGVDYQLYFAIRTNDKATMERLLLQDMDVNTMYGGKTLLHWAIMYGQEEIIKILLDSNAKVNEKTANGDTSLYLAIKHGLDNAVKASKIIEMLLARDADINVMLKNGDPILCWTIRQSNVYKGALNIVKLLLRRNPNVNLQSKSHETALYLATRYGFDDVIDIILEQDVDVNIELKNHETPLYWAAKNDLDSVVDKLLKRGAAASVNVGLANGETPLYWAVRRNSLSTVEKLLEHGASDSLSVEVMDRTPLDWAGYFKHEAIVKKLKEFVAESSFLNSSKRTYEASEADLAALKKRKSYYQNPVHCLLGPSGHLSSNRMKRNVVGEGCEISWEDVNKFNEEKENTSEFSKIKINSDKLLDILKNPSLSEIKRTQLLQLADKVVVVGESKEQVYKLVQHQKILMRLKKVGHISSITMYGMTAKNMLRDFLEGDYEGVAINVGFIAGGQGLARVAEAMSIKGASLASNGQFLLGRSLRMASPFLARGTSVFITYDLINQIKAYQKGSPDAVVGIIEDSIYLGVDGIEIGIELAEIGGLLEGVSSVTGPIGAAIGAIVFVGTDVYLAVKKVNQIDALIHLTSKEKFIEGMRVFVGMKPEQYIERLRKEKQGNNQLFNQGVSFLKKHSNIQRYIFPTVKEKIHCIPKRRIPFQSPFHSNRQIGIASDLETKYCNAWLEINLDNNILLSNKRKDIKWSRTKPDATGGSLFCVPIGNDLEIPSEGAYFCDKAMGIEWIDARTGNITFIELGNGNDIVIGFPQTDHVVMLGNGHKTIALGDGDDVFLLTGKLLSGSILQGGGGMNTLDLAAHAQPFETLNGTIQIQNYLLRENESDYVPSVACSVHYIDTRGGKDDELGKDQIIISNACVYSLKVAVRSHTNIMNFSGNRENKFIYLIPTTKNKGNSTVFLENSQGSHQFVFAYELFDIYRLVKANYTKRSVIKFSFKKNARNTPSEEKYKFRVLIHCTDENKLSYALRDNTVIKVIKDKFYAFQTTNCSVEDIINNYPPIAERSINLSIFVHSTLTNESVAIGHGKHDVLSNDPYRRSHLIGNGGENIFVIHSGYEVLDSSKLPIPEIVLYDKDDENLTDTLDLREIRSQLEECFGVEIKIRTNLVVNTNDLVIELFLPKEALSLPIGAEKSLVTVRLKDVLLTNWHRRLHIILNYVPMALDADALDLKPLPLKLSSDKEIIIIHPEDVEENTEVITIKKLGDYHFYRLGVNLIVTNMIGVNLSDSEYYALSLQNFYQRPKLQTLSIKFIDKELFLQDEMERIHRAPSLISECNRYNQTLFDMLFNHNVIEKSILPALRSHIRRSHHDVHPAMLVPQESKGVWGSVKSYASYLLPSLGAMGAVFGAGMGLRYQMRNRLRVNGMPTTGIPQVAALAAPLLAPVIEAKSITKGVALANIKDNVVQMDRCSLGAWLGDELMMGVTCYTKNMQVMVFLKDSDVKLEKAQDRIFKESCRPVEFNGRPSVYCEGEKTNIVYTPDVLEAPLERINGLLMLFLVGLDQGKKLYHWLQNVAAEKSSEILSHVVPITTEQKTIWIELLVDIETRLIHLTNIGKAEDDLGWVQPILEDRKEEYQCLSKKSQASLDEVTALTEDLQALQAELKVMMDGDSISASNRDDKNSDIRKGDASNNLNPWSILSNSANQSIGFKSCISQVFFKHHQPTTPFLSVQATNSSMSLCVNKA